MTRPAWKAWAKRLWPSIASAKRGERRLAELVARLGPPRPPIELDDETIRRMSTVEDDEDDTDCGSSHGLSVDAAGCLVQEIDGVSFPRSAEMSRAVADAIIERQGVAAEQEERAEIEQMSRTAKDSEFLHAAAAASEAKYQALRFAGVELLAKLPHCGCCGAPSTRQFVARIADGWRCDTCPTDHAGATDAIWRPAPWVAEARALRAAIDGAQGYVAVSGLLVRALVSKIAPRCIEDQRAGFGGEAKRCDRPGAFPWKTKGYYCHAHRTPSDEPAPWADELAAALRAMGDLPEEGST